MGMGIKELLNRRVLELWDDVNDVRFDDKAAPDLGDVIGGRSERFYSDAGEFFRRTYVTVSMRDLLGDIVKALNNEKGGSVFLLTSLFGGGKTHTQIFLYHAFNSPDKLSILSDDLSSLVASAGKPLIVVMDGSRASLVPNPKEPYEVEGFTIRTIWGMLAYRLGVYGRVRDLDNENSPVPSVDLIRSMFSDVKSPVIILLDEIVHYVFNMINSEYKKYGDNVLLFLDYLARAVESSPRVVLVVSIQAEYRKEASEIRFVEEDVFRGVAGYVLNHLRRESTKIVVPVAPDDVVKVLQKRIFKKIDVNEASNARDRIYKFYREHNVFGSENDWQFSVGEGGRVISLKDTYPFHTKYIEVLHEIVMRNRDLQKTRDAIRITRKVIRRLLRSDGDADFIMPWHIDLRDREIRRLVLSESKKEFDDIASRDIISEDGKLGSISSCSKPQLAFYVGSAVLLKTYVYDAFNIPLKAFPDVKDVALMVFEPETFRAKQFEPADIETVLNEMVGRLPHFVSEAGRYWFTPFPSIIEYVDKRAEEILRGPLVPLYNILKGIVEEIIEEKKIVKEVIGEKIFGKDNTVVIGYGDDEWVDVLMNDSPSLRLVVLVKPGVSEDEIRKIILMRGSSNRMFRNSIVVVCPKDDNVFDELLKYAARKKAAEEIGNEIEQYYRDRDVRDLMNRKLKKYSDDINKLLNSSLLSSLTKIYYPARIEANDTVKSIITTSESSLVLQVEKGLSDPSTGPKLRSGFEFDDLSEFLKRNSNLDLVEGSDRHEFREIVNTFFMITSAPFTTRDAIQQAVFNGLEKLDVGILMDGILYWKRIGPDGGCEKPSVLKDSAEILSYKIAAEMLRDKLLKESGRKTIDKEVHKIWYEVRFGDRSLTLDELIKYDNWQKILKESIIIKHEEVSTYGFIIDVKPTIVVRQGQEVIVDVDVNPVHEYSYDVELIVEKGEIIPNKGSLPLRAKWSIGILEPGSHEFKIIGRGSDGKEETAILSVIVESEEVEKEVEKLDKEYIGAKLISIKPKDMLALRLTVDAISKLNWDSSTSMNVSFADEISFSGKNMEPVIVRIFAEKFNEILGTIPFSNARFDSVVSLKKPIVLNDVMINNLRNLFDKVVFRLRMRRG
jgi:predicted AAA+ superfamily ATPase